MLIESALLMAFIITLITEFVVVYVFRRSNIYLILVSVLLINSFTHPLFIGFGFHIFGLSIILVEVLIFVIEAFWYKIVFRESLKKSAIISFSANMASLLVGFLFRFLF